MNKARRQNQLPNHQPHQPPSLQHHSHQQQQQQHPGSSSNHVAGGKLQEAVRLRHQQQQQQHQQQHQHGEASSSSSTSSSQHQAHQDAAPLANHHAPKSPRKGRAGAGHSHVGRTHSVHDERPEAPGCEVELSVDGRAPGVLKIFGHAVVAGVQYKSVLASTRSTAQELVKQALERFGLPPHTYPEYVLCDVIGHPDGGLGQGGLAGTEDVPQAPSAASNSQNAKSQTLKSPRTGSKSGSGGSGAGANKAGSQHDSQGQGGRTGGGGGKGGWDSLVQAGEGQGSSPGWRTLCMRVLEDSDRPLEQQAWWRPRDGCSRRYELHRRADLAKRYAGQDDTFGLNDNARKIMMAKVPPGAIPLSKSWGGGKLTERVREEPEGFSVQAATSCPPLDGPGGRETSYTLTPPPSCPFLLTVRGYDPRYDPVLLPLRAQSVLVGRYRAVPHVSNIGLLGPDILDKHCCLLVKSYDQTDARAEAYRFYLEVNTSAEALVTVNGQVVKEQASVHCGDLLGLGSHYLFLYKDLTGGHDLPAALPWLPGSSAGLDHNHPDTYWSGESGRTPCTCGDDCSGSGSEEASRGRRVGVSYARDKEEEVVRWVGALRCLGRKEYPLTPAILLAACEEYAARKFSGHHMRNFYRRVLHIHRERVAEIAKGLSSRKYESPCLREAGAGEEERAGDLLRLLLYWMANGVQLYCHLRPRLPELAPRPSYWEEEASQGLQELLSGLEEIVAFSFQQTVYSITKVLYPMLQGVLEWAGGKKGSGDDMARVTSVLQTVLDLAADLRLHPEVTRQLMTYLLFFMSTTLFNRVIAKDGGGQYLSWAVGVRLQASVSQLEGWVTGRGLEAEFLSVSHRLLALADLLATSKHTLLRLTWEDFRRQYSPLSEPQLAHVLRLYQQVNGLGPAPSWAPPHAVDESEVAISLTSHPSFSLPRERSSLDLGQHFPDSVYRHLEELHATYGITGADDSDSGLSVSNTPRVSAPRSSPRQVRTFYGDSPSIDPRTSRSPEGGLERQSSRPSASSPPQSRRVDSFVSRGDISARSDTRPGNARGDPAPSASSGNSARQMEERASTARSGANHTGDSHGGPRSNESALSPRSGRRYRLGSTSAREAEESAGDGHPAQGPRTFSTFKPSARPDARNFVERGGGGGGGGGDFIYTTLEQQNLPSPEGHRVTFDLPEDGDRGQFERNGQGRQSNVSDPGAHSRNATGVHYRRPGGGDLGSHGDSSRPQDLQHGLHARNVVAANGMDGTHDSEEGYHRHQPQRVSLTRGQSEPGDHNFDRNTLRRSLPRDSSNPRTDRVPLSAREPMTRTENEFSRQQQGRRSLTRDPYGSSSRTGSESPEYFRRALTKYHETVNMAEEDRQHYERRYFNRNPNARPSSMHADRQQSERSSLTRDPRDHSGGETQGRERDNRFSLPLDLPNSGAVNGLDESSGSGSGDFSRQQQGRRSLTRDPPPPPPSTDSDDGPPVIPPRHPLQGLLGSNESDRQQQGDGRHPIPGEAAVAGGGGKASAPVHNYQYLSGSAPEATLRHALLDEVQETPSASSVSLSFSQTSQTLAASESENYNVSSSSCSSLPDPPEDMLNQSLSPRWGSSGGSNPDRPRHPIVPPIDLEQIEQLDAYLHSSLQSRSPQGHGDYSRLERRHSSSDLPQTPPPDPDTPLTSSRSMSRLHGDREGEGDGDRYPDEIYVDIPSLESAARSSSASQLRVLSLDDGSQPVPANIQQELAGMAEQASSSRGRQVLQSWQRIRDTAQGEITGEVFTVTLHKDGPHLGLGLIDGLYTPLQSQGIYIRNIMPGTPASQTSRLEIGDRILAVNGRSIVGADYHSAMKLIRTAGSRLNLLVAKCDKHVALKIIATRF